MEAGEESINGKMGLGQTSAEILGTIRAQVQDIQKPRDLGVREVTEGGGPRERSW